MSRVKYDDIEKAAKELGVEVSKLSHWDEPISPGDMYLAGRNTGVKLLTCWKVNEDLFCIHPKEKAYPYDFSECFKVNS